MSRTYRRKKIKECEISKFGYLDGEFDTYSWFQSELRLKWDFPIGKFESYADYCVDAVSRFYRDCGYAVVLSYNRSPWCYRNRRNRRLRMKHKQQIHHQIVSGEYDVVIDPFTKNAGWDYW